MTTLKAITASALVILATCGVTTPTRAAEGEKPFEAAILGGVQALTSNDTAIPDDFVNIPLAASLAYHATPTFVLEGEVAWLIPTENSVNVGSAGSQDLKSPDVFSYQASLRAQIPVGSSSISPYVIAGAGAVTFLSTSDADRYPQLPESQTVFAINFGVGTGISLSESFSLRTDFRELVAFPQDDATGLSDGTDAEPIWMPRGTIGLSYWF